MTTLDVDQLRRALDVPATVVDDATLQQICDAVDLVVLPLLTPAEQLAPGANVVEAELGIAVQVWHAQQAPGGQMVGVDMSPTMTPYLLGAGLVTKYLGLLGPSMPYGGSVVA